MNTIRVAIVLACSLAAVAILPATAAADTAADLGVDYGDVEPELRAELQDEVLDIFEESATWEWLPAHEGFDELEDRLKGCYDQVCLLEIASELDAVLGISIRADVESDIYEWSIEFYDLLEGEQVGADEGSCPLCGRAEVIEEFRASLHGRLVTLDVGQDRPAPDDEVADEDDETERPPPEDRIEVRIGGIPEDTGVLVDGDHRITGPGTIEVGEGTRQLEFVGEDHDDVTDELVVDDDTPDPKWMRFHIAGADTDRGGTHVRDSSIVDSLGSARAPLGWTAILAGTGLTAGSFWLAGRHGQPACDDDVHVRQCPEVYNTAGLATTTTIVGVLSVLTGATLVAWPSLTERPEPPAEPGADDLDETEEGEATLRVGPSVGGDFNGISIEGAF